MVERKKSDPPLDDPEESARFIATAKELGADKDESLFGLAVKKVIKKPKRRTSQATK